jgi:FemAB-related protein (PEP-CTERM system-associated)
MLTCEVVRDAEGEDWQGFAARQAQCGLYHHIGWKRVVEDAYGHYAPYLIARTGGRVTGILPLVAVRSRLFGASLTSLPFVDHAGVAAVDDASRDALVAKAVETARELRVRYLELRQSVPLSPELETATHKVLMTLPLPGDADAMWSSLSSERRNRVRRAQKAGLTVEVAGAARLPQFYDIWTRNMRDLGSPPHSQDFFASVMRHFAQNAVILLVQHEQTYIGAALGLFWKDTFSVPWVSSLREHFQLYPNNALYWDAIRFAIGKQIKTFDFGRSTRGSGTYEFKQRWGARENALNWQFVAIRGTAPVPTEESSRRLAVRLWKRLPLAVTRVVGPALRKNITA